MKKEYIIFEPKDELGAGFKIVKSDDNTLITFEKYGKYNTPNNWEHAFCEPKHLDKIIEVLHYIKMNIKAVKGLKRIWRNFMLKKKSVIKVKDMPPEWQKNYNAFYQAMINASEEERHQIVEDRKKNVIEKIRRL